MLEDLETIQKQGYTKQEARLIQIVQAYSEDNPEFGVKYSHGAYSLADIVRILAPEVEIKKEFPLES